MDWNQASFLALSLTGLIIMAWGSFGAWLLCAFMSVTRKLILLPIGMGALVVAAAIKFFGG